MSVIQVLKEKIKHPTDNSWIETMYIEEDSEQNSQSIYWHGTLADDGVIQRRHLSSKIIGNGLIDWTQTASISSTGQRDPLDNTNDLKKLSFK